MMQVERNLADYTLQLVKDFMPADVMASSQALQEGREMMLRDTSVTEVSSTGCSRVPDINVRLALAAISTCLQIG